MKKNIIIVFSVVAFLGVAVMIWFNNPVDLMDVDPQEVKEIVVFNGSTGQTTYINEQEQIQHIIENLNDIQVKRTKLSVGYSGFGFDITIYPVAGKETVGWRHFVINGEDAVRRDPFFYTVTRGAIDYSTIENVVS